MNVVFRKTNSGCSTSCTRRDGFAESWESSVDGAVPHDLVHWIVEDHFKLKDSFFGYVARGKDHHSVNELADPESELSQTERLVLNIQGELGVEDGTIHADPSALRGLYGLEYPSYCSQGDVATILDTLHNARANWNGMRVNESIEFEFDEGDA